MKIKVSNLGIYDSVINELEDADGMLYDASDYYLSDVSFGQSQSVSELDDIIRSYRKELACIITTLAKSERHLNELSDDTINSISSVNPVTIRQRLGVRDLL